MAKKYLSLFILISVIFYFFVYININLVSAQTGFQKFTEGYKKTGENAGYPAADLNRELPQVIGRIIQAILTFLGIIFLFLMIYGGYTWMLARGNENETKKAKDTITNAIIGLLIVAGAYAITLFIQNSLYHAQYIQTDESEEEYYEW